MRSARGFPEAGRGGAMKELFWYGAGARKSGELFARTWNQFTLLNKKGHLFPPGPEARLGGEIS